MERYAFNNWINILFYLLSGRFPKYAYKFLKPIFQHSQLLHVLHRVMHHYSIWYLTFAPHTIECWYEHSCACVKIPLFPHLFVLLLFSSPRDNNWFTDTFLENLISYTWLMLTDRRPGEWNIYLRSLKI